jgi:2-C-methyl-D-erythritol 4-phosphate cytidylyltransferase
MNIAIILAGGNGTRIGGELPKQFLKIAGKMVIEHTIDVFEKHNLIDEIVIVTISEYLYLIEEICLKNHFKKVVKILKGGTTRNASSLVAINSYDGDHNIIFHDAVRPLVTPRIITDCIHSLKKYSCVDVAVPSTDTIIKVSNDKIEEIPNRNFLMNGQTPQGFKLNIIKKAYKIALKDPNLIATDDCSIVLKYLPLETIHVIKGEYFNIKLTHKDDLVILNKLFQQKSISLDNDFKFPILNNKVAIVIGGNYGIGSSIVSFLKNMDCKVYSFSRQTTKTDISNINDIKKALSYVYNKEKKINFIINTAGVLHKQSLFNMEYSKIQNLVSVNLLGSVFLAKESYKYLRRSKGCLLFFTSSSYTRGRSLYSIYSATKAAIVNLTQALSEEWLDDRIRVNCISPQRTATPMRLNNFGIEPPDSLLSPEEVAIVAVKVLCSNLSGEVIDVNFNKNDT